MPWKLWNCNWCGHGHIWNFIFEMWLSTKFFLHLPFQWRFGSTFVKNMEFKKPKQSKHSKVWRNFVWRCFPKIKSIKNFERKYEINWRKQNMKERNGKIWKYFLLRDQVTDWHILIDKQILSAVLVLSGNILIDWLIWYLLSDYCYLLLAIFDLLYVTCYLHIFIWNLLLLAKTCSFRSLLYVS